MVDIASMSHLQGTTHCPPDLHCAALGLLRALWHDCRESALTLLRKRYVLLYNKKDDTKKEQRLSINILKKGLCGCFI